MRESPAIVPFEASHAAAVLVVIGAVFREYAMTFDPSGFDADLTDIRGSYLERGGRFWVLVDDGRVVGTVAVVPAGRGACEGKRLYLLPAYRGRGLGRALMERVFDWARMSGSGLVGAGADARPGASHVLYERLGLPRLREGPRGGI